MPAVLPRRVPARRACRGVGARQLLPLGVALPEQAVLDLCGTDAPADRGVPVTGEGIGVQQPQPCGCECGVRPCPRVSGGFRRQGGVDQRGEPLGLGRVPGSLGSDGEHIPRSRGTRPCLHGRGGVAGILLHPACRIPQGQPRTRRRGLQGPDHLCLTQPLAHRVGPRPTPRVLHTGDAADTVHDAYDIAARVAVEPADVAEEHVVVAAFLEFVRQQCLGVGAEVGLGIHELVDGRGQDEAAR